MTVVYTLWASGHFVLKNSTYEIDQIYKLLLVEKDVKTKHKISVSTISR